MPSDFALLFDVRLDRRVLLFTLGLSIVTGILFSLIPALQSSKPELVPSLKEESSLAGLRRSRLRNSLVVAQVAFSLVLLVSAGLIVRSLQAAQHLAPASTRSTPPRFPSIWRCRVTKKRRAAPFINRSWNARAL